MWESNLAWGRSQWYTNSSVFWLSKWHCEFWHWVNSCLLLDQRSFQMLWQMSCGDVDIIRDHHPPANITVPHVWVCARIIVFEILHHNSNFGSITTILLHIISRYSYHMYIHVMIKILCSNDEETWTLPDEA